MHIDAFIWSLIVTATLLPIGYVVYLLFVQSKRKMRSAELRLHIDVILDKSGCSRASELFEECWHLIKHYHIDLMILDHRRIFNAYELKRAAIKSLRRHCWCMWCSHKTVYAEFCFLRNKGPEGRSPDERSRYRGLRETVILTSAELNKSHFRLKSLKERYL